MPVLLRILVCLPALATATLFYWLSDGPLPEGALPPFAFSDKLIHYLAYGFLACTLPPALRLGAGMGRERTLIGAALLGIAYGGFDELHQGMVPGRQCDLGDFIANTAGVLTVVLICRHAWKPGVRP